MTSVHLAGIYSPTAAYQWPCWAEPKVDGWRCLAICDEDGAWAVVSREGMGLTAVCAPIVRALARALPDARGLVLDGELAAGTWGQTTSELQGRRVQTVRLHVFDVLDLVDYRAGVCADTCEVRRERLCGLGLAKARRWVSVVARVAVASPGAFSAFYGRCLAHGYEGAVLKMRGSPWALCRDWWFKCKPGEGA